MKTAVLFVFMSAAFAGHYFVQAQNQFSERKHATFWHFFNSTEYLDHKAHSQYTGLEEVPKLGPEALKNYPATREALRQSYLAECQTMAPQLTVRVQLDEKGRYEGHSFPEMDYQDNLDHIFQNLSFKRAFIKGLSLVDLTFSFASSQ